LRFRITFAETDNLTMKSETLKSHFKLHFVVLIYGFTAILGKLITLPATQLVWFRMLIAAVSFYLYFRIRKKSFRVSRKDLLQILGVGLIVGAHWITFFGAIKISNVSVTLGCLASTTLFTSFLEPLFYRRRLNLLDIFIGLMIIAGLYMVFRFETQYTAGILVALTSAFLAGLFTVLNKKLIAHNSASVISFYEMLGGFAGISIFLAFTGQLNLSSLQMTGMDLFYLLLLAIVCTAFAFAVQVDVMRELSAYIVALTINLEPIYGILLAFFIFGESEQMTAGFYAGTAVILLAVFGYPIYHHYKRKRALLKI